ncbi:hypothetical protein BDQ17DRAFT_1542129 [Cyathus striatus]|nr:hypothetical protein BDQ17DRAFT_1542129 [Cyathus striatus]
MVIPVLPSPEIPDDVLRLVFEYAALYCRKSALKLALLSHDTRIWIEPIIYSEVSLFKDSTAMLFLRTIKTSHTKRNSFFSTYVKCLSISSSVGELSAAEILYFCRGAKYITIFASLTPTFFPVPGYGTDFHMSIPQEVAVWNPCCLLESYFRAISQPDRNGQYLCVAFGSARPQHLSLLLRNPTSFSSELPLYLPFFSQITHLSILNKWEDWTAWTGFHHLPNLTHISFEIHICESQSWSYDTGDVRHQESRRNTVLRERILPWLEDLLDSCQYLELCIAAIPFQQSPGRSISSSIKMLADSNKIPFIPNLTFIQLREPFYGREAHSALYKAMWTLGESIIKQQKDCQEYIL